MMAPSLPRRRPVDPRHCSSSPDNHSEQLTSVASDQQYPSNVGTFPLELWRFRSSAVAVGARHHTDGLKVLRRLGAGYYVNVPVRLLQERTRLFTLKCFYTRADVQKRHNRFSVDHFGLLPASAAAALCGTTAGGRPASSERPTRTWRPGTLPWR